MHPIKQILYRHSADFWVLVAFLALLGFTAGGSRSDISSLILVRPVAVLLCAYLAARITRAQIRSNGWFLWLIGAAFLLVALHLVPLPPTMWHTLPGRGLIADIDRQTGLGDVWRPLSIAPLATRNALFSLFVPLAVGLLLMRLSREERLALIPLVVGFGCISLLVSIFQIIAPSAKALWLYRMTNDGLPVGLFSNRNHSAMFLATLLPMLPVWAQSPTSNRLLYRSKRVAAFALGFVTVVVIIATGSRAGLLLGVAGLSFVPFLIAQAPARRPAKPSRFGLLLSRRALIIAVTVLGIASVAFSLTSTRQNSAIERLSTSNSDDMRITFWSATAPLVGKYFPLGSGFGTFVEGYKVDEPQEALNPAYANHAHNDPLELAMTGGLPAIAIMVAAVILFAHEGWQSWRSRAFSGNPIMVRRMASAILLILLLGSIVDYPLRTPSLTAFALLASFWLRARNESPGSKNDDKKDEGMAIGESVV